MKKKIIKIFNKYTIDDLTLYVVVLTGSVTALDMFNIIPNFGKITQDVLSGEQWWNILFYAFNLRSSGIFGLLISLYVMWAFGIMLESYMGRLKYNLYILTAYFAITLGTMFLPIPIEAYHLEFSIFLACTTIAPEMQILLFFIVPIKMRWIGIVAGIGILIKTFLLVNATQSLLPLLNPITGFSNYILFFIIPTLLGIKIKAKNIKRKKKFATETKAIILHRCTVCGITENDDPDIEFRFCTQCGDHEYCMNHLHNHEHQKLS